MFSIQNLVSKGKEVYGKEPGEWYDPSSICNVLEKVGADSIGIINCKDRIVYH